MHCSDSIISASIFFVCLFFSLSEHKNNSHKFHGAFSGACHPLGLLSPYINLHVRLLHNRLCSFHIGWLGWSHSR